MEGIKICVIHQPDFFPWLGYFNKIVRCDKFAVLDDALFQKTGSTWLNRVAINIQGNKRWVTVPVLRKHGVWKINETYYMDNDWRENMRNTLQTNYAKANHFRQCREAIFELVNFPTNKLLDYNVNTILKISELLEIDFKNKVVFSSSLNVNSTATQRLIDITKAINCDTYMSGGGAGGYQEDEKFYATKLKLAYQNFKHPEYPQFNTKEFIAGLSIIDVLFNCGFKKTRDLIHKN